MRTALLLALIAAAAAASGCGESGSGASGDASVTAVVTTTQLGDFAREVGGERVDVRQLLPPNADPHDYEPRPSDALAFAEADVVLRSGGDLDEWLGDLIETGGGDAKAVEVLEAIEGDGAEARDPHWWQNPENAVRAVEIVRDELTDVDPEGRETYQRNAAAYVGELERLDRSVARCIAKVPAEQRKLVTTHDALGHYADRYGLEVIGAVIPSLSTEAQPSAKDVEALVEQIRDHGVKAVFPESSVNPKLERAVSREAGARVGAALWADSLGPDGSSGATYISSIQANTKAIVDGLTGGRERCRPTA